MKNIKVNIPEGHEIDTANSDLEKGIITFKKEESKYPMVLVNLEFTIEQYWWARKEGKEGKEGLNNTKPLIEKYETFIRLVETCKEWNRIDGFEADWSDNNQIKYCMNYYDLSINFMPHGFLSHPLHFKDENTAKLFFETFRTEIELVKDLI